MVILEVNAYHGDAAACLFMDGRIVVAAEEERFKRVKHWAGFPAQDVRYSLAEGAVRLRDGNVVPSTGTPKPTFSERPCSR